MYLKINAFMKIAICLFLIVLHGQTSFAQNQSTIDSLETIFKKLDNKHAVLINIEQQMPFYFGTRNFEVFDHLNKKGLELATELKIDSSLVKLYVFKGNKGYVTGNFKQAKTNYLLAIEMAGNVAIESYTNNIKSTEGRAYNNLGLVNGMLGYTHLSLQNNLSALQIFKELNDSARIAIGYLNIGALYASEDKNKQAEEYFSNSLTYYEALNNMTGVANNRINLGAIAAENKDYTNALEEFKMALEVYEQANKKEYRAIAMTNIAECYVYLGLPESARNYLEDTYNIYSELQDSSGIAEILFTFGIYHNAINEPAKAEKALLKAIAISSKLGMVKIQLDATEALSKIYAQKHNYKLAYGYLRYFDSLNTKYNTDDIKKRFSLIEEQYEEETRQKEAALKELEINTISDKLKYNQILSTLSISGFLLIIVFIIILFRKYKLETRIKIQLEKTNHELERINNEYQQTLISKKEKDILLKEIHHRVKNNLQIINSLLRFQAQKSPENSQSIFQDLQSRITAMSLLHDQLYMTKDFSKIDVGDYFTQLINNLKSAFSNTQIIDFDIKINVDFLDLDTLHPLGLLVNEIISNSLKYAFSDNPTKNKIYLYLDRSGNDFILKTGDTGKGIDKRQISLNTGSIGFELINNLSEQLDGKLTRTVDKGTHYQLKFSKQM